MKKIIMISIIAAVFACNGKKTTKTTGDSEKSTVNISMDNDPEKIDTSCSALFSRHGKCFVPEKKHIFNIPIGDSPWKGSEKALVTIVEFSEFQCPACAGWSQTVFPEIMKKFPDDVKLVFKHFPLDYHPLAQTAALMSMEVKKQAGNEGFWKFHDLAFENQKDLSVEKLIEFAKKAGVKDTKAVDKAVENEDYKKALKAEMDLGMKAGVSGTPWVYINGELFARNVSLEDMIKRKKAEAQKLVTAGTSADQVYKKITDHGKPYIEVPIEKSEYEKMLNLIKEGFLKKCGENNAQVKVLFEIIRRCSREKPHDCATFMKCIDRNAKILHDKSSKN
ncbi:DsbA family protein [Myxococcota bacterium]|nr:DsbA family protein [Myxococcota bacterium]MBU1380670.1 DsbA family protein [Myxococcota bacterium]MBU1495878.1 DsbA family protein [Myxococcota bacterium]